MTEGYKLYIQIFCQNESIGHLRTLIFNLIVVTLSRIPFSNSWHLDFWQHLYLFTHSSNCNTILEVFRVWVLFVLFCRFLLYFADCHNCTERCNWDSSAKYSKKWQNKWLLLQPRLMKMITCQFLNLFTSIYLRNNQFNINYTLFFYKN